MLEEPKASIVSANPTSRRNVIKKNIKFVLLCLLFSICTFAQGSGLDGNQQHSILVTGEATVRVVPDQVTLNVGAESINRNLAAARRANEDAIRKILAAMRGLGISEQNLQTDYINISPKEDDDKDCMRPCNDNEDCKNKCRNVRFYVVRRTLVIALRDVSIFDKVLSAALDAGATEIQDIQFQTTEVRKYRDQARVMAIRAAREKADLLVREAGTEITGVVSISEEPNYDWTSYYGRWWGRGGSNQMAQNAISMAPAPTESGSSELFAPGQLSVTAKVSVVYALK